MDDNVAQISPTEWSILERLTVFWSLSLDSDTVSNEICEERETDDKLPVKQDELTNCWR